MHYINIEATTDKVCMLFIIQLMQNTKQLLY